MRVYQIYQVLERSVSERESSLNVCSDGTLPGDEVGTASDLDAD